MPVSLPLAVRCEDGALRADMSVPLAHITDACERGVWNAFVCGQALMHLNNFAGIIEGALPPALETIEFDWHHTPATWFFGNNASRSVLTFDDGGSAVIPQQLIRSRVAIPVLDAAGNPVLNAAGAPVTTYATSDERGRYWNLLDAAPQYAWTPPAALRDRCFGGMAIHSDGRIQADLGTADGRMDVVRSVNCAFPMPSGDHLGISISTMVTYDWDGELL